MTIKDIKLVGSKVSWTCDWGFKDTQPEWSTGRLMSFVTDKEGKGIFLHLSPKSIKCVKAPEEVDFSQFSMEKDKRGNKPIYSKIRRMMINISAPSTPPNQAVRQNIAVATTRLLSNR